MKNFLSYGLVFLGLLGFQNSLAAQTKTASEKSDEPSQTAPNPKKEKLTIVGRVQFRGVSGQIDSSFNNGHRDFNSVDWNFRRVRFGFNYDGASWWGVVVQLRVEDAINRPYVTVRRDPVTNQLTDVQINDNRGILQEANIHLQSSSLFSRITFGQSTVPFFREFHGASSANLINVERSMMTQSMGQFDLGVKYGFKPLGFFDKLKENHLVIEVGIYNGRGSGLDGMGRRQVLTDDMNSSRPILISPMYAARAQWNVFGGLKDDSGKDIGWREGDEIFQKEAKLSLGIAHLYTKEFTQINRLDPNIRDYPTWTIFTPQTTPSGGNTWNVLNNNTQTSPYRRNFDLHATTVDATFTWNGYYLNSAFVKTAGLASNSMESYQGTFGYNFSINEYFLMPVIRADYIQADSNRNNRIDDFERIRNYWAGLVFFGDRHLLKMQLFYSRMGDRLGFDPSTGNRMDARNDLVIFQLQGTFWTGPSSTETKIPTRDDITD